MGEILQIARYAKTRAPRRLAALLGPNACYQGRIKKRREDTSCWKGTWDEFVRFGTARQVPGQALVKCDKGRIYQQLRVAGIFGARAVTGGSDGELHWRFVFEAR